MNTKEKVSNIIKTVKPTVNLENVTDIIDGGYLDSLELMGLISSIMEEFNIEIDLDLITPQNFNSIEMISKMVDSLLAKE